MYKFPRTAILETAVILHTIKASPSRIDLVLSLQRILIRRITRTERRIKRIKSLKAGLKRSMASHRWTKVKARKLKLKSENCDMAVRELQYQLFIWRCLGDGIAFTYLDKYALKHLYYDGEYNAKESAGFLTGKTGFRKEWKYLCIALRMDVPVILSDLTNIIRHGDLCLLGNSDPVLVEVKSSENRNARTTRQEKELRALGEFFRNDQARNWRGNSRVVRLETHVPERQYIDIINHCIDEATKTGFCALSPEPGLSFFVDASGGDISQCGSGVTRGSVMYSLQPTPDWSVAYPFTLALTPPNLMRFLCREVQIAVLIDLTIVKTLFSQHGTQATMMMNGEWAMQFCLNPKNLIEGVYRISEQRFARIACEFQSLSWFAEEMSAQLTAHLPPVVTKEEYESAPEEYITELPTDWTEVKDFWDEL